MGQQDQEEYDLGIFSGRLFVRPFKRESRILAARSRIWDPDAVGA